VLVGRRHPDTYMAPRPVEEMSKNVARACGRAELSPIARLKASRARVGTASGTSTAPKLTHFRTFVARALIAGPLTPKASSSPPLGAEERFHRVMQSAAAYYYRWGRLTSEKQAGRHGAHQHKRPARLPGQIPAMDDAAIWKTLVPASSKACAQGQNRRPTRCNCSLNDQGHLLVLCLIRLAPWRQWARAALGLGLGLVVRGAEYRMPAEGFSLGRILWQRA